MKETILITGATGFLGSHLLHRLYEAGIYNLIVLKRTSSNIARISDLMDVPNIKYIDVDNVSNNFFRDFFTTVSVDVIIHTATYYGRESDISITKVLESNIMFPLSLLEEAVNHGLKFFINTDSYFNKPNQTYKTLLDYSLSKKTLNLWLEYLSERIKVANLRLEHMYGENDSPSKFVELMIRKIAVESVSSIALTYGQQKRDFIYINDVCDAFIAVLQNYNKFSFHYVTFEVGTGRNLSVRDFVESIKRISGSKTELDFGKLPYREDEIMSSKADTSFLNNLGWKPNTSVEAGLTKIINTYKEYGLLLGSSFFAGSAGVANKLVNAVRQPIISLCIPSSGRIDFLEKTLDSIFAQNINFDSFEVCISDNSGNNETRNLIERKYKNKNVVLKKSQECTYLNLIEALKLGTGKYLKLLNDYTSLITSETLKYMIDVILKYECCGGVVFFKSQSKYECVNEYDNFDSFHSAVSYLDTWAPCFGIYKKDFDEFIRSGAEINQWFPHDSILYAQAKRTRYIVVDTKIFNEAAIRKKGGYNLPQVFGVEYISMNEELFRNRSITAITYNNLREAIFDFIARWYSKSKYDKKYCSFDFTDTDKRLAVYYSEKEIKRFYSLVHRHSMGYMVRRVFWLPLFVRRAVRNSKLYLMLTGGGVQKYSKTQIIFRHKCQWRISSVKECEAA